MRQVWFMATILLFAFTGCAQKNYQYGLRIDSTLSSSPCVCDSPNPIANGEAHAWVDRIENVVQAPRRFFKKHRRRQSDGAMPVGDSVTMETHDSPSDFNSPDAAIAASTDYLQSNGMDDVYVDVRCYEPQEQWRRLKENDRISPLVKYTAGSLDVLVYTMFPRRAFQIDSYSPFTNTLSLNSNRIPSAVFAAAEAKEYRDQRLPGLYAVMQHAPLVPLVHSAKASSDVLTYAEVNEQWDLAEELYPRAYSKIASSAISDALFFVPLPADLPPITAPAARLAGISIGRATGKVVADNKRPDDATEADESVAANLADGQERPNQEIPR